MIGAARACLGGMSEFPLVGQGGLASSTASLMLASALTILRTFSRTARRLRRSNSGFSPRAIFTSHWCKPELALKLWRERNVIGRRTHQHGRTEEAPPRGEGRARSEERGLTTPP
jgi:hypothetical protein